MLTRTKKLGASLCATALLSVGLASPAAAQQTGLVNVQIGDITIEDVNVVAAANIVAGVCANIDIDAAVAIVGAVEQTGGDFTGTCEMRVRDLDLVITDA